MFIRTTKRGFTLVELVVVVVVIAILLAFVLPILKKEYEKREKQRIVEKTGVLYAVPWLDEMGEQEIAKLLNNGAEVNALRQFPTQSSIIRMINGKSTTTDIPIDARMTSLRRSPLAEAVLAGRLDLVQLLLDRRAEVNGVEDYKGIFADYHGMSESIQPIIWAAFNDDDKMFDFLIQAGASLDARLGGKTVIEWAEEKEFLEEADWLRAKQAELMASGNSE